MVTLTLAAAVPALAQTTANLTSVKDSTIRGGSYASTRHGTESILVTRASSDSTYLRRAALTFDTETTIPDNATIQSATLVLTVRGGNSETRQLRAYGMPVSFDEPYVTWNSRSSSVGWSNSGGDTTGTSTAGTVTGVVGSQVSFDVTAHVQAVLSGQYGSRYARFLVVDGGASSRDSYKEFHARESTDSARRPRLVVSYGSGTSSSPSTPPTSPSPSGSTLKVLAWNIHHGVGTDGVYDINRLATWMATMNPHVILLNEVEKYTSWGNEEQPSRFKNLLQQKTGRTWYAHFIQEYGQWTSKGKGHLILSLYPFDDTSGATITQSSGLNGAGAIGHAAITVNGRLINLFVTHLDPYDKAMRLTQARDVISWMSGFAENRILTGDMNAWPDQTSILELYKYNRDSWVDALNKGTASAPSDISPYGATKKGRIDYIMYSKGASNLVVISSKVYDTRSGGVMPSDHRPVLTTFEVR
jgi:endonuclease/exonuclease/phosphatase family metal-dependent hydrolase